MNPVFEENYLSGGQAGSRKLRILVAPLDWGLGHATRCIPVIYELIWEGCQVWLAGEGAQEALLRQEFPDLGFLPLSGYRVKYNKSGVGMSWRMILQSRKIFRSIQQEKDWLETVVKEYGFDAVIADNRYGLYHETIPCIFITHQLTIKSPWGKWTERLLQAKNYKYINRFNTCWVPDEEGQANLAGELSHPSKTPDIPVQYIGLLSRLKKNECAVKKGHLLISISGPEPQRSMMEEKIIKDIAHYEGSATIARGLPAESKIIPSTNSIKFYNHLTTEELNKEMNSAEYVIGRSGYSTIMDIVCMQKKSILIPTPGQTEQEYLGRYLMQSQSVLCISQQDFHLADALKKAKEFSYHMAQPGNGDKLRLVIKQFVASLS